jgi:hypothetical protein
MHKMTAYLSLGLRDLIIQVVMGAPLMFEPQWLNWKFD